MKKILAFLMAVLMLAAFAGCGEGETGGSDPVETADPNKVYEIPADLSADPAENPITYFSMNMADLETSLSMLAYPNEDGTVTVDFTGEERKVVKFGAEVFDSIADALADSGALGLGGRSEYAEGDLYAGMFVQYADETFAAADFSGTVPQEFSDAYSAMSEYFTKLTAEAPVYVPQPVVAEGVNAEELAAMLAILNGSKLAHLDSFMIDTIPMDEFFGQMAGLSETRSITGGTACSPMMMTTAYSLVIVTVADEGDIDAIRADFESNLNWNKWVCVSASNAAIAQNGSMVLCLLATDELYDSTLAGIEAAGWSDIAQFENEMM